MWIDRPHIATLYTHLLRTRHPLSPPVLILTSLDPDSLCATRILTRLLKHDYIQHKIQPIAGYSDLTTAAETLVAPLMTTRGGTGGLVVCLGIGGMADMGELLGLEEEGGGYGGVEVWLFDSRRPWNLSNLFGGYPENEEKTPPEGVINGLITPKYKPGAGGIIVFDDGDIADKLNAEAEAYTALLAMPEVDEDEDLGDSDESEDEGMEDATHAGTKRKISDVFFSDDDSDDDMGQAPAKQRRRSNESTGIPVRPQGRGLMVAGASSSLAVPNTESGSTAVRNPSQRALKRRLLRLRATHEETIHKYYTLGTSFSDPISVVMYSLASELGRSDNDFLWYAIVGVSAGEVAGRTSAGIAAPVRGREASTVGSGWMGERGMIMRRVLRDEVRRLNPPDLIPTPAGQDTGMMITTARSPDDYGIRLSPEPKFLLVRHWSLYDSMLHSPYLFSRLHTWNEQGIERLNKLITKMGISQVQARQNYVHMDPGLKRDLRPKLNRYASIYNLEEMVPSMDTDGKDTGGAKDAWGFVKSWGWKATLSSHDVAIILAALLEVGMGGHIDNNDGGAITEEDVDGEERREEWITRFWQAYDAVDDIAALKNALPTAMHLHRAIFRTGKALINKKQIKHLRAFRLCVVKEGPDIRLFTHPAALTKLALWIGEALTDQDLHQHGRLGNGGRGTPLVAAGLDEKRGVYMVVGSGGGGGPDASFIGKETRKRKGAERERKAKEREEKKKAKAKIREEKKAAKRKAREEAGEDVDDDDDDDDEESEDSEDNDSSDDDSDSEDEGDQERGFGLNRFGAAFREVIGETGSRVRIDSFECCVVEVRKDDLASFLEALSMKTVIG